jgi:hypothetical protein
MNYPTTPCAITALGDYDWKRGGHLVLFDLNLYVEFPPGTTILISSACFMHGNVPIQENERRYSFTQFSAGSLMQWSAYGCRLANTLEPGVKDQLEKRAEEGLEAQMGRLSLLSDIYENYAED